MPFAPATPPSQLSLFDDAPPAVAAAPPPPVFRHPRSQREIRLDGHLVGYEMRRGRRRSIGFVVGPEGLSVSAPRWAAIGDVESALKSKAAWILRKLHEQRDRARRLAETRIEWADGAAVPFLGRPVVVRLSAAMRGAMLDADAGELRIGLPHGAAPAQIRDAVQSWLQRQARRIFEERCALFAERLGVRVRRLGLSSATTRWGSASADGSIRLHWRLVHFALPVIDYVVTHELAHLREMNHGPAFWEVVRSVLPGYEAPRGQLRTEVLPAFD